jgi:hypothetical protein
MSTFRYDVFVSYAWLCRKPLVRRVVDNLREAGITVWFDESDLSTTNFLHDMMSAVRHCRFFVLFASRAYCASKNCRVEAMSAFTHKDSAEVIVVNVETGGFNPATDPAADGEVAAFAQRNIWVDMTASVDDEALAKGFKQLLAQLRERGMVPRAIVPGAPASAPPPPAAPVPSPPTLSDSSAPLVLLGRRGISAAGMRAFVAATGGDAALAGKTVVYVRNKLLQYCSSVGVAYCYMAEAAPYVGEATAVAMWTASMDFLEWVQSLEVYDARRVRESGGTSPPIFFWVDFFSLLRTYSVGTDWELIQQRELASSIGCTLLQLEWRRDAGPAALRSSWCTWEVLASGAGSLHVLFAPTEEQALESAIAADMHLTAQRSASFHVVLPPPADGEEALLAAAIARAGGEAVATRLVQSALGEALSAASARVMRAAHSAALAAPTGASHAGDTASP